MNISLIQLLRLMALTLLLIPTLLVTASCVTDPILNIKDAPVKTLSNKELPLDQITRAIVLAGMGLKWQMDLVTPGHIVGTLNIRSHQAVVDVTYNPSAYSIQYKRSKGLLYGEPSQMDGPETREIHKNYNGWIENLDNAIRTQLIAVDR
ncbi:MAG: hypothetical protein Q8L77_10330 [Nitrospirota bacterium]|nr:hypothetical protein [Nitrospirota bacterium]